MSAGKIALGLLVLAVLLFVADDLAGRFIDWRKRRDELIRNETLNRYSMGAFKAVSKDWRQS